LTQLARTTKIDYFNSAPLRIAQQNILGLQIAMDYAQLGRCQKHQRRAQLLSELARQIQRNAAEIRIAQQVIQVIRQQLEH
jgi:hypothetical protein